ncbi:ABC transporter ATP-binding protein [Pseudomonas sp. Marseille-Q5117]|uniref:ABC transporter ATP-binding protein n=1 Tax=Pseudomonas sp. Marseille-Q5117 TaxID=2972777 RepID=UPI0021C9E9E2|nr:ABC transporter ATP-binding protein [Pseudomonas sp. Marseille-Q5117]
MTDSLIIRGLSLARGGKRVLDQIDINIEPGRITAVLGPNGAGKSSLVMGIAGALPLLDGSVCLGEQSLTGMSAERIRRAGVAAVPEGHLVFAGLSVLDNLKAAGNLLSNAELANALEEVFEVFPELAQCRTQAAQTLSGGQQQMVALAHALMARPRFILVDEMSLGLAPVIVKRLEGVIELLAQNGTGILLIEQFTQVALRLADYVYVMNQGRVVLEGDPQRFNDDPQALQRAYLAHANQEDQT